MLRSFVDPAHITKETSKAILRYTLKKEVTLGQLKVLRRQRRMNTRKDKTPPPQRKNLKRKRDQLHTGL